MTIKQLSDEQIRRMSLEEKDLWWLTNVYQGNMPQLTLRSALTGMILGGVLSLTNLYIGIRTGWSLGVGISSVVLSFAFYKFLSNLKIGKEITLLENNAMQSIATSAGYMTAPLVSSIPAYMIITNEVLPQTQVMAWIVVLSLLGVLFAFPLKKRFINDEQLPFPEGRASGIVMDSLHRGHDAEALLKAKILVAGALISALVETLRNNKIMEALRLQIIALPESWDAFLYKYFTPRILGTPLKDLTIHWDSSLIMLALGGLINIKTALSLLIGAFINYWVLAPICIKQNIIAGGGFKNIVMWSLWGGVSMMTTASLFSFFSKPQIIISSFKKIFSRKISIEKDVLKNIELPLWVSAVGIPAIGLLIVIMGNLLFDIDFWMGIIAIPLVFVFSIIAVNATGLTSVTPTGALAKLTQLNFSVLAPGNMATNIMTASITAEVALNASCLLTDIKPGYMLGAKPRQQAMGHVLGIFAGALVSVPVFYAIFQGDLSLFTSEKLPLPAAQVWKAVAEVLTKGFAFLHPTARIAILVGAVLGILFEILEKSTRGKWPISGVGMGLAFVLPFSDAFAMSLGAFIFWFLARKIPNNKIFVANQETLCAGVIAGGSIIGIVLILLETLLHIR